VRSSLIRPSSPIGTRPDYLMNQLSEKLLSRGQAVTNQAAITKEISIDGLSGLSPNAPMV